jgi:histidinol-phosphatase (PHP family)
VPDTDTDDPGAVLPADDHVHSEWSWDTSAGDMVATCAEAVRIGLPSVAFTEHVDHTVWTVGNGEQLPTEWTRHGVADGELSAPVFDVGGYLESIERCRAQFPELRIVTGVELGEPHWHQETVAELLETGAFTRVLASLHSAVIDGSCFDVGQSFDLAPARQIYTGYLAELERLVTSYDRFEVLAHIDYPLRYWPPGTRLNLACFEDQLRHLLGLLRDAGKVLEVNTQVPLPPTILRWWHEAGGETISFASDAHRPERVARGFAEATALAEATGFRPGRDPLGWWHRS